MKTQKLKSIQEGIEMGLSVEQCQFISTEMKKYKVIKGIYRDATQGVSNGFITFDFPKVGYFAYIGDSEFKTLREIARKSDTTVKLYMPQGEIRFYAQGLLD